MEATTRYPACARNDTAILPTPRWRRLPAHRHHRFHSACCSFRTDNRCVNPAVPSAIAARVVSRTGGVLPIQKNKDVLPPSAVGFHAEVVSGNKLPCRPARNEGSRR